MFDGDLSYNMCSENSIDGLFQLFKGNETCQCQMGSWEEKAGQAANSLSAFSISQPSAELAGGGSGGRIMVETPARHS